MSRGDIQITWRSQRYAEWLRSVAEGSPEPTFCGEHEQEAWNISRDCYRLRLEQAALQARIHAANVAYRSLKRRIAAHSRRAKRLWVEAGAAE